MLKLMKSKRGQGFVDSVIVVLSAVLVIAFAINIIPVFIAKQKMDTFATELCREAVVSGSVGPETDLKTIELQDEMGINPVVSWSETGPIQLNTEVTVTLNMTVYIGGFGNFVRIPIQFKSQATGKSEVYQK